MWIEKQTKRVEWKPDIIVVTKGRKKYVIEIEDGGNNKRKSMFGEILFAFLHKQVSWLVIIMNFKKGSISVDNHLLNLLNSSNIIKKTRVCS